MNEIEQKFYDALMDCDEAITEVIPQHTIGIYKVDFLLGRCAIEVDGHEYHKTKEQREHDYKKDRYLIRHGYLPVRYMATEVFLDASKCATEVHKISNSIEKFDFDLCFADYTQDASLIRNIINIFRNTEI